MAVLLVSDYGEDVNKWREELKRRVGEGDVREWPEIGKPEDIEVILTDMPMGPKGGYRQFSRLRWISFLGHGAGDIVRDPELPTSVPVTRLKDPFIIGGVSEYVVHAVISHHLRMREYQQQQPKALWERMDVRPASSLHVAVLGLGSIGSNAAKLLRQIGFRVSGWTSTPRQLPDIECHHGRGALEPLLRTADYVVSMLPETTQTVGLMNRKTFAAMKPGAYFVNTGRGSLVVEADLIEALDSGKVAGACLDVTKPEPLPSTSPLWRHPRVTVTPHTGGTGGAGNYFSEIAENYRRLRAGEPLQNLVDTRKGY